LQKTINIPNSSSYSFLQEGEQYTKDQLSSKDIYDSDFENVSINGTIDVTFHDDSENENYIGSFIKRKIETQAIE
jgi:hypothetical protein